MSYTYKKLTEVELVENAVDPNLLIEENGEIKKMSASDIAVPQVKADWNEEDPNNAAFILNKPDLSQVGGGGAKVITYCIDSAGVMDKDQTRNITPQEILDAWNEGAILRMTDRRENNGLGTIDSLYWSYACGSSGALASITVYYSYEGTGKLVTIWA